MIQLHEHHIHTRVNNKNDEISKLLLNDVVLIRDDSLKRNVWKKGKVEKLVEGKDGKIRGALLKVCHGGHTTYIHRPLQRIVPLEVQKDQNDESTAADRSIEQLNQGELGNDVNSNLLDKSLEQLDQCSVVTEPVVHVEKRKYVPPERWEIKW